MLPSELTLVIARVIVKNVQLCSAIAARLCIVNIQCGFEWSILPESFCIRVDSNKQYIQHASSQFLRGFL